MATPVASTSQPAQLSALQAPHADEVKEVKKKGGKTVTASAYPLEVRVPLPFLFMALDCLLRSCNPNRSSSITVSKYLRS